MALCPLSRNILSVLITVSHIHTDIWINYLFITSRLSYSFLSHLFWEITESKLIDDLKGSVSRDFWPLFFHDSNPSGLLTNILIYFNSVLTSTSYFIVNFENSKSSVFDTVVESKNCWTKWNPTFYTWNLFPRDRCAHP